MAELEHEEEMRDNAGVYVLPKMELSQTMLEIKELAKKIRDKRAILRQEALMVKQSTKPIMPRHTMPKSRERSVSKLVGEMEQLGKYLSF